MRKIFTAMNTKFDSLLANQTLEHRASSFNQHKNGGGRNNNCSGEGHSSMYQSKFVKFDFSQFNGGKDPTSWVCHGRQLFDFHQTPDGERVPLASFHLEGVKEKE
ncbi:hypothetical protein AAC387_Pa09g1200 [Persea americana]